MVDAPYLDSHGELDPQLRKGRALSLNAIRLDEFRKIWFRNDIGGILATKIDQGDGVVVSFRQ